MDCGDVPVTPMDSHLALEMMTAAYDNLLNRKSGYKDSSLPPRLLTLGGDHSIILPVIRNLFKLYALLSYISTLI